MEERCRRRGEREMRAGVVGERAYYRLHEAKGGVVWYVERRKGGGGCVLKGWRGNGGADMEVMGY